MSIHATHEELPRARPETGPPMDNSSAGTMLGVAVVVAMGILTTVYFNVRGELHSSAATKASTPPQATSTAPAQPAPAPGG